MKKLISIACLNHAVTDILVFKKGNIIHTPGDQLRPNDSNGLTAAKRIILEQVGLDLDTSEFSIVKESNTVVNDVNVLEIVFTCSISIDEHKKKGKQVHDGYIAEWMTVEEFLSDKPSIH